MTLKQTTSSSRHANTNAYVNETICFLEAFGTCERTRGDRAVARMWCTVKMRKWKLLAMHARNDLRTDEQWNPCARQNTDRGRKKFCANMEPREGQRWHGDQRNGSLPGVLYTHLDKLKRGPTVARVRYETRANMVPVQTRTVEWLARIQNQI